MKMNTMRRHHFSTIIIAITVLAISACSTLIEKDGDLSSVDKAEEIMRKALQRLMEIRGEHGLPKVCS